MKFELLSGDRRHAEIKCWEPWFHEVGRARHAFRKAVGLDPMCNETASMGVLAAAASRVNMLAMTDYVCRKRGLHDGRSFRHGRADLWVYDPNRGTSWVFEAKQFRAPPGARQTTFEKHLRRACHEAARVPEWEADRKFGILIVTGRDEVLKDTLSQAAAEQAERSFAACRFDGGELPAYAFIRAARRRRMLGAGARF